MLLTIDVGNTNIKFGIFNSKELVSTLRLSTDTKKTADEYSVELYSIFKVHSIDSAKLNNCIISSVVPKVTQTLKNAIKSVLGIDALVVGPGIKTGVNIRIEDPSTLGSDLVVGCAAAQSLFDTPCIVISMGTATAICVVDKDRIMQGGIIAPGVSISLDALTNNGALLPSVALNAPKNVIGKNTDECIRSGIVLGTACMIDGIIDKIESQLGYKCQVVATGGLAPMITNNCSHSITVKDDLILQGLRIIFEKNS